jgi:GAF domain-containing protein
MSETRSAAAERLGDQEEVGLLRRLLTVPVSSGDPLERQRASLVLVMSLIFGLLGLGGSVLLQLAIPGTLPVYLFTANLIGAVLYLLAFGLVRLRQLRLANFLFVALTLAVPLLQAAPGGFLRIEVAAVGFAVSIVAAAFLLGPRWAFASGVMALIVVLVFNSIQSGPGAAAPEPLPGSTSGPGSLLALLFLLLMLAVFAWLASVSLVDWARNAQRRAQLLEAAVVVSETAAASSSLSDLLNEVVDRIRETYGFYHAQVFLLDQERRMARLEASTGRAGQALLARGHALGVGSRSVIGECTAEGHPVIVNDVRRSQVHRPNPLLPDTLAELALPLGVGSEVIGALDVQATRANAFQPDDVRSLQIMAAQLATSIEKARLVDELQRRASENERLYQEAHASLQQLEDLNRQVVRETWQDYLQTRRTAAGLGYTLQSDTILHDTHWSAPMRQAYQGESSVIIREDLQQAHIAAVPLRVRGEVIGVLEIERGGEKPWSDTEIEMVETLVDRLGMAIENARLYEQATLSAEREQIVNRISQDVQSARSIEEVLQSALAELSDVLGASRGVVHISPKDQTAPGAAHAAAPDRGA